MKEPLRCQETLTEPPITWALAEGNLNVFVLNNIFLFHEKRDKAPWMAFFPIAVLEPHHSIYRVCRIIMRIN
jgi:hypothetical protein